MSKKAIVTGNSRGLGAALTSRLKDAGWEVLGISRSAGVSVDLSDPAALVEWLERGELAQFLEGADEVLLINNAGTNGTIALVGEQDPRTTISDVNVNLIAPILLTNAVIAARPSDVPTRIAHISSGIGRRPAASWGVYAATKAGVDMHARAVIADAPPEVRIAAIAPGVVDTYMQEVIRAAEGSPQQEKFTRMHAEGLLTSPDEAAAAVLRLVEAPDFGEDPIADVRD